jgi:hypothetical protein
MMLLVYIAIIIWLAKGLVEILIGLAEIAIGLIQMSYGLLQMLFIFVRKNLIGQ